MAPWRNGPGADLGRGVLFFLMVDCPMFKVLVTIPFILAILYLLWLIRITWKSRDTPLHFSFKRPETKREWLAGALAFAFTLAYIAFLLALIVFLLWRLEVLVG